MVDLVEEEIRVINFYKFPGDKILVKGSALNAVGEKMKQQGRTLSWTDEAVDETIPQPDNQRINLS